MTERERTTMVPFPSDAIIPERDLGTRPVLDARHLGVEFGGLKAVDDFNMIIGRTEIAGLIGPNGAGKTTIFNLITKVYQPTTGTILIDGKDTAGMNTIQVNKAGIARTFQNIRLFNKMSVEDNVKIGLHNRMRYGMGTAVHLRYAGSGGHHGGFAALRRAAAAGDRPRTGYLAQVTAAGRACGGHEPL